MREDLGVFPHNIASSSVLVVGDYVYATTSNGQDWSHLNIPSPMAPCLVVLNKNTGEYAGEEASGISKNIMHCNWSSPGYAEINGRGKSRSPDKISPDTANNVRADSDGPKAVF